MILRKAYRSSQFIATLRRIPKNLRTEVAAVFADHAHAVSQASKAMAPIDTGNMVMSHIVMGTGVAEPPKPNWVKWSGKYRHWVRTDKLDASWQNMVELFRRRVAMDRAMKLHTVYFGVSAFYAARVNATVAPYFDMAINSYRGRLRAKLKEAMRRAIRK